MSAPPQHFCTRKMHRQIYADFVVHTGRHAMPTYWASAPMTVTFDNENKSTPYAPAPSPELIVSHIFSWTRSGFSANLFSCWLRAVTFPKRRLREFVRG